MTPISISFLSFIFVFIFLSFISFLLFFSSFLFFVLFSFFLFVSLGDKYSRVLKGDLPEVMERVDSNSHSLQSYMIKIKRLDEIIQMIQRKNDRNFFKSFLWTLLTWLLSCM